MWQRTLFGYSDAAIAIIMLALVIRWNRERWLPIVLCAFLADWPDIMRSIPVVSPWLIEMPIWKQMNDFHNSFHAQTVCATWYTGLWGQVLVIWISMWLLRPKSRDSHPQLLAVAKRSTGDGT